MSENKKSKLSMKLLIFMMIYYVSDLIEYNYYYDIITSSKLSDCIDVVR
jgi:hypothetical protein